MGAFEDFVNLELPRRAALLNPSLAEGYDGDPNDPSAPAILQGAPLGTQYYAPTPDVWYRKRGTGGTDWEELEPGGGGWDGVLNFDITQIGARDWTLSDNEAEALAFGSTGCSGLLVLDTTNGAEEVEIGLWCGADVKLRVHSGVGESASFWYDEAAFATAIGATDGPIGFYPYSAASPVCTVDSTTLWMDGIVSCQGLFTSPYSADFVLADNTSDALEFLAGLGGYRLLVLDTTDGSEQVRIGATANAADFPKARMIVSQIDTGYAYDYSTIGLVIEAEVVGLLGFGRTNGADPGQGFVGYGSVSDSADTGAAIGVGAVAFDAHTGSANIALDLYAAGSTVNNWAISISGGDIRNAFADMDWVLADNKSEAIEFRAPGYSRLLVFDTTNGSEQVRIGTAANAADFPHARAIISQGDTGATLSIGAIGLVGEAVSDDTNLAVGLQGYGKTSATKNAFGARANAVVDAATDVGIAVAGSFYSTSGHTGGANRALWVSAANSSVDNWALYIASGGIFTDNGISTVWQLDDNNTTALSFDTVGHTGLMVFDTTNGAERITMSGGLQISGDFDHDGSNVGFFGTAPTTKPTVTGSRGGNVALASLLTSLAGLGLITDSTTV